MKKQKSKTKTAITSNGMLPEVKMGKTKNKKINWVRIDTIPNSIIITPKEIESFKKHGIDLLVALKTIQKEIYKKPKC